MLDFSPPLCLGREKEKKINVDVREKHWSVAPHTHPNWGPNLQPSYMPESSSWTFSLWDNDPTNWATPARAVSNFLQTFKTSTIYTKAQIFNFSWKQENLFTQPRFVQGNHEQEWSGHLNSPVPHSPHRSVPSSVFSFSYFSPWTQQATRYKTPNPESFV